MKVYHRLGVFVSCQIFCHRYKKSCAISKTLLVLYNLTPFWVCTLYIEYHYKSSLIHKEAVEENIVLERVQMCTLESQYFKGQLYNEEQIETAVLSIRTHRQFWLLFNVCHKNLLIIT